jgi:MFS family permease
LVVAVLSVRKELQHTFRSLSHRNFRIYFVGQIISISGTWTQGVALSWLIYRMTKSSIALGAVECAHMLPMLVFGLVGGSLADRSDRRTVLLWTQTLAMGQAIVLATLTLMNRLEVWQAIALAAILGTVNAFEVPSRQALLVSLVDKEDLVNAISLNSSLFNAARAVGPALAALIVTVSSEGVCFVLNALSYLAALFAIASLQIPRVERLPQTESVALSVREGLKFAWSQKAVRRVLCLAIVVSLFGMQYSVLMPIFASEILHGDVRTLGILRGAAGLGALAAALTLAHHASYSFLRKALGLASLGFGVTVFFFALSGNLILSTFLIFLGGFCMTTQLSGGHSIIQLVVTDRLRGRVMSVYMTVMLGIAPLGSLAVGFAAHRFGAPLTIACCAALCVVAGLTYLLTLGRGEGDAAEPAENQS